MKYYEFRHQFAFMHINCDLLQLLFYMITYSVTPFIKFVCHRPMARFRRHGFSSICSSRTENEGMLELLELTEPELIQTKNLLCEPELLTESMSTSTKASSATDPPTTRATSANSTSCCNQPCDGCQSSSKREQQSVRK